MLIGLRITEGERFVDDHGYEGMKFKRNIVKIGFLGPVPIPWFLFKWLLAPQKDGPRYKGTISMHRIDV